MSIKRMSKMKLVWSQSMVNLAILDPETAMIIAQDTHYFMYGLSNDKRCTGDGIQTAVSCHVVVYRAFI
ncbi:hypothetical protein Hamer_G020468 [Homarus americanus]|uniref:Uncharacterized protein n=1 Tax=Homarus americanus TaxID=6706 RepID=A0A8J5MJX0_HOMAM|nr:hypothetical protein Hamer_G020468 [Homarus americanus]